ncbi:hypothetical protein M0P65_05945 [Candidatus Gracilibacteria bacterium]|nr:hypothetical protein [Candidatus Gracilibacteria bacterium]
MSKYGVSFVETSDKSDTTITGELTYSDRPLYIALVKGKFSLSTKTGFGYVKGDLPEMQRCLDFLMEVNAVMPEMVLDFFD